MIPYVSPRQSLEGAIRDYIALGVSDANVRFSLLIGLYRELDSISRYVVNRPKGIICAKKPTEDERLESGSLDGGLKGVQLRGITPEETDAVYCALAEKIKSEKVESGRNLAQQDAKTRDEHPVMVLTVDGLAFRIEETIKEVCCKRRGKPAI